MSDFKPGDIVLVSADADDVYFEAEVVGRVVPDEAWKQDVYVQEERVLVEAKTPYGSSLRQYVRPEDLTILDRVEA